MYQHNEVLAFDGTVQGLLDQLHLLVATMPKSPAFVQDTQGTILNRVKLDVKTMSDGESQTWDVTLFEAKK